MNNIFRCAVSAGLALFAAALPMVVDAQQTANVSLSGNLNGNAGANNYSGFPMSGLYHLQLVNQGIQVAADVVQISLVLPPAFEFMATYPGLPAGWVYTRVDLQTAKLVNVSDPLEVLPDLGGIVTFDIPITTVATTAGQASFGWGVVTALAGSFNNWTVPSNAGNTSSGFTTVGATPLSIKFLSFEAKAKGNCMVNLNWETAAETNTEKFLVERSADGASFKAIGEVEPAANADNTNAYSFVDQQPAQSQNLYRIRHLMTDGKSDISDVRKVSVSCNTDAIALYPNPTDGLVYIKGLTDKGSVKVYNALGQLVLEKQLENTIEGVNMTGLAEGFYQVNVLKGKETIFSTKLIKK